MTQKLNIEVLQKESDWNQKPGRNAFIDFMHEHLGRFGDPGEAIGKSIDYAFSDQEGKGGFLLAAWLDGELVGGLVMNRTGMEDYIPENILVYVAVDENKRGRGIGRKIIEKSFEVAKGSIKLHVEYDNPAKRLYEKMGFTNKYAEMRYTPK